MQISGASANTFTGLTTVNAGELILNKTAGVNAIAGSVLLNTGGTLSLAAADQIINTATMTLTGGTFNMGRFLQMKQSLVWYLIPDLLLLA